MTTEIVYLASPYWHEDPHIRYERFVAACRAAKRLIRQGKVVFSPIAHSHSISDFGNLNGHNHEIWMKHDRAFLAIASELIVLKLLGLEKSLGVAEEMAIALARGIPVTFMEDENEQTIAQYSI